MLQRFLYTAILLTCCFYQTSAQDSLVQNKPNGQDKLPNKGRTDSSVKAIYAHIEQYSNTLNKVNIFLQDGLDTNTIVNKLPEYEQLTALTQLALNNQSNNLNMRALNSTRVILKQMKLEMKSFQEKLFQYNHELANFEQELASIDSNLLASYPSDNALTILYKEQFADIEKRWKATQPLIQETLYYNSKLQGRVTKLYIHAVELISLCEQQIKAVSKKAWQEEDSYLFQTKASQYKYAFSEVFQKTIERASYLFTYYLSNTWKTRSLNILLTFICWLSLTILYRKSGFDTINAERSGIIVLRKSILLSCILLACTLAPFIYVSPPAVYVEILWYIIAIITLLLNWNRWTAKIRLSWIGFLIIMLLYSIDSLLLFSSFAERYTLFLFNLLAIGLGWFLYQQIPQLNKQAQIVFRYAIIFFLVLNGLAVISNLIGRFTLAKLFSSTSDTTLALAISLSLVREIVLESVYLILESTHKSGWHVAKMDQESIRKKIDPALITILSSLWLMTVAWGMNIYEFLIGSLTEFMQKDMKIGSFHFTFSNVLIFFLIIWLSNLLSELLTVVFGNDAAEFAKNKKNKSGSWILLLKLLIYVLGFLLAVSAAGFPLDKITIIIGALGVGIGFGLQNIVNNLVSGIILAFEKPITIGDVIEVGSRIGTVKEIGIRSSKINTYEGAEIIIPNGDLISSQLINWTRNNSHRRVEVIVGIAYHSDIPAAKNIVTEILNTTQGILQHPQPAVLLHELADSSINLRILFWVEYFDEWTTVKSNIIQTILQQFRSNQIEIPFPQRDIHIKNERQS